MSAWTGGERSEPRKISRCYGHFARLTPLKNFAMLTSFRAFGPDGPKFRLLPHQACLTCKAKPAMLWRQVRGT